MPGRHSSTVTIVSLLVVLILVTHLETIIFTTAILHIYWVKPDVGAVLVNDLGWKCRRHLVVLRHLLDIVWGL
jgi:hypothetical protein